MVLACPNMGYPRLVVLDPGLTKFRLVQKTVFYSRNLSKPDLALDTHFGSFSVRCWIRSF